VWGARTNTILTDDRWRYVPVRRLLNSVERDARAALRAAVFEPNSAPTWEAVRIALENYLHALWRQGALLGATAAEAYFVHVGLGITMTETDIQQGHMIVKIGLAAVRPAEFIILSLTQDVRPN
jgi:phage tail sheath protein FI